MASLFKEAVAARITQGVLQLTPREPRLSPAIGTTGGVHSVDLSVWTAKALTTRTSPLIRPSVSSVKSSQRGHCRRSADVVADCGQEASTGSLRHSRHVPTRMVKVYRGAPVNRRGDPATPTAPTVAGGNAGVLPSSVGGFCVTLGNRGLNRDAILPLGRGSRGGSPPSGEASPSSGRCLSASRIMTLATGHTSPASLCIGSSGGVLEEALVTPTNGGPAPAFVSVSSCGTSPCSPPLSLRL